MSEKVTDAEILKNLRIYAEDGVNIHTMMRDMFLEKDNTMGTLKHQGSLDVVQDIIKILNGTRVATLAEVRAEIKKAENANQNYLG
jgi:hypothetical protein